MLPLVLIFATSFVVLCTSIYFYLKMKYKYWEKRGVIGPKPKMIFGNVKESFFLNATEAEVWNSVSRQYENNKYVGVYNLWKPVLLVKDLELAKNILEKHFDHFTDHPKVLGQEKTDYAMYSLFAMEGDVWKTRRQCFNKLFTPKKLREYTDEMQESLEVLMKELDECAQRGDELNIMDVLEKFTIHAIMASMYGLDITKDEKRTSDLVDIIRFFVHPPAMNVLKFIFFSVQPTLFKLLKMKTLPEKVWNFSSKLLDEMSVTRDKSGLDRQDALTVIKKLQTEGTADIKKIDYKEAVGHVFSFSEAGSHTTSTVLSHVFGRLAQNPDIQDKVRQEIDSVLKESKTVTYENVSQLPYLDNVITETMRINPLVAVFKRTCTKEYKIDEKLTIPKGMDVIIDLAYIHNNPEYFKEPENFMPERYSKGHYDHAALMPFGKGPRTCIGIKFAEVEMKVTLARILSRYTILPSDKVKYPMTFNPRTIFFSNVPLGSIWVKLKLREC